MECQLEDMTIYYEVYGQGRPILFLHGWTLDHRAEVATYEPIFSGRSGWQRTYLDLPCHGRSSGWSSVSCQEDLLSAVLAFVDANLPERRLVVCGSSSGALLARGVVYHRAEWLDGLLLNVPLIVAEDARRTLPEPSVLWPDASLMEGLSPEEQEFLSAVLIQKPDYVEGLRQLIEAVYTPSLDDEGLAFLDAIRQAPDRYSLANNVDDLPGPFPAPALIVTGRQDSVVGYRDAWSILENYPRATFAVLDRADHGIPYGQEGLFAALVNEWLDRVEEYSLLREG